MKASPLWMPTPGGQVFAWYHPPAPDRSRRCAVLLCDPFGWHRMVLHLAYRQLALRLAEAGFPVLRVDYPGTCDSEGWPRQSARVETWLASLEAGLDALKAWSGAKHLAVFGALLGGTLGAMLASRRPDVTALALWGTYVHGRTAVRSEIAAAAAATTPLASAGVPPVVHQDDREAFGFLLSAELIEDLRRVDLLQIPLGSVRSALILPRPAVSTDGKLAGHLAAGGSVVDHRVQARDDLDAILHGGGAGYPRATIEDIAAWLEREFPELDTARAASALPLPPPEVILDASDTRIRESAAFLGADGGIFGILSEPLAAPLHEPAVVLVSGGRNHRSGINRNYTEWARKLAARGHRVLRIDLRGLGDSPPPWPDGRDVLYSASGRQDVLDAVAWLKARGTERVVCVGLCAGSYQAFHAALAGSSVAGLVMLNPLAFHADRANDSDGPSRVRKTLRRIRRVARRLVRRLFPRAAMLAWSERRIARSFLELAGRGVDVCIVYNENEPYLDFLRRALLPVRDRLEASGRFRIETVGQADHIYSPLAVQAEVTETLLRYIGGIAQRGQPPAGSVPAGVRADVVLHRRAEARP
jgi:pimeloyl-ACP methyl ester carboxylesterase